MVHEEGSSSGDDYHSDSDDDHSSAWRSVFQESDIPNLSNIIKTIQAEINKG